MKQLPDITLKYLNWRYARHPSAKRAYEWIREDIERLGWRAWLEAQDDVLMAEREHLLNQQNQHRAEQLLAQVDTLQLLASQSIAPSPDAWSMLRDGISEFAKHNERLTASLSVYATMHHSLRFLIRLSHRKRI